nr:branched-chain alpha-keto acid dehydrogenase subunit E2 [Klebsiella pneumoniae]
MQESAPAPFESIPMSGMRRAIASRLQTSKQQSPHFRLSVDLDLERLLAFRQEINREVPGVKISVNDLLVKACARRWWPCQTSTSSLMKRHKVSAALRMPIFRWLLRCLTG